MSAVAISEEPFSFQVTLDQNAMDDLAGRLKDRIMDVNGLGQNFEATDLVGENDNSSPPTRFQRITSAFQSAVKGTINAATTTIRKTGSLAYDFAKANPIITGIGVDIALTGGAYTQAALVNVVQTVAGATGELASGAASSVWNYVFN
ncbi:MAG: hypothetical protein AAF549_08025 [Pseudomonadota bacterium]